MEVYPRRAGTYDRPLFVSDSSPIDPYPPGIGFTIEVYPKPYRLLVEWLLLPRGPLRAPKTSARIGLPPAVDRS